MRRNVPDLLVLNLLIVSHEKCFRNTFVWQSCPTNGVYTVSLGLVSDYGL